MKLRKCGEIAAILRDWMISCFPIEYRWHNRLHCRRPVHFVGAFHSMVLLVTNLQEVLIITELCCKVVVIMNVQVLYSILGPVIYQCLLGIVPSGHA